MKIIDTKVWDEFSKEIQTTKKKIKNPKLKLKISNKDTCQLNRDLFKKDGESKHN